MHDQSTTSPDVAYSYIRFSSPEQSKGDSLRRQTEAALDWCRRNNIPLDKSLTLRDLGKSAFTGKHRKNPDTHALAAFLKLAEQGRIARGSYLIIENLDRLSRENERDALRLWMDILDLGVNIVQLNPETVFRHEKSDMVDIIRAIIELSRGHSESAIKSERVGQAWREKKRRVREGETQKATTRMGEGMRVATRMLPAWIEERDGKAVLIPERAAAVKRVFQLAATGLGYLTIAKALTREKVQTPGESGKWNTTYIANILKDRRAVGEYQPRNRRDGTPDGPPVPGYFPAAVTEEEFWASRKTPPPKRDTRVGKYVNLFPGLLKNARNGETYSATSKTTRLLVSAGVRAGRTLPWSFPLLVFEEAIVSRLREIDPHDILNGDGGPDATTALAAEYARVEAELFDAGVFMEANGFSPTIGKRVQALEERKRGLGEELAAARRKAAHPLSEAWGEAQSLATVLATTDDPREVRERLRSAVRRIVSEMRLLVVERGRDRLCAVQVYFVDRPPVRSYLIYYRAAGFHRKMFWQVSSLADVLDADALDLRNPDDVKALETALLAVPLPER